MKRVLVIEDDVALSWLLEKLLQSEYQVVVMNDGLDAWAWLSDGNFCDLVVSDINVPSLPGTALLENLRTSGLYSHLPIIILSALEEPKESCLRLGAMAYLTKPFNPYQFLQEVRLAVNHQLQ